MIKINRDGISIYSEEQLLNEEKNEVQKNVDIPEGSVVKLEEDSSYKLIENADDFNSPCSLSTLLKGDSDKEVIIEFLLDKKEESNQIQTILNKFKQPIPQGFVELKTEGINYVFSTPAN